MPDVTETLYLGLKFSEWITVLGLLLGPIVAVVITMVVDGRRKKRDQQLQVLRMLLTTRHLPADAAYSVAINLVPVEFNADRNVMSAWERYVELVRTRPTDDNAVAHGEDVRSRQTKLIFAIMQSLGFKLAETDIQTSAYVADGFIRRDNLMVGSWAAMIDIATTLKQQTAMMGADQQNPSPTLPGDHLSSQ